MKEQTKTPIFNIEITQGSDTNDFEIFIEEDDGSPIDLNGFSGLMHIRPAVRSDLIYDTLSTVNSRLSIESYIKDFNGVPTTFWKIVVKFPSLITTDYHWVTAVYDLEIYAGSLVDRIIKGEVFVDHEVTIQ